MRPEFVTCSTCPWQMVSDLAAVELPTDDGRFVRLRMQKVDVILTRRGFYEALKLGKAWKRVESLQRRLPQ